VSNEVWHQSIEDLLKAIEPSTAGEAADQTNRGAPQGSQQLPRVTQMLLAVRARALLDGRLSPSIDDVLDLAEPVLKHRMALTFSARAEGRTIPDVIRQLKTRIG